jgi:hypothetical protein
VAQRIDAAIPSVVVSARTKAGTELTDVSVSIDGKQVASSLDSRPIELDPGAYRFRYERSGAEPIERQVVLKTGLRNHLLEFTFPGGAPGARKRAAVPVVSWVLAGTGVVALGSFTYFGLSARSEYNDRQADCGPLATRRNRACAASC